MKPALGLAVVLLFLAACTKDISNPSDKTKDPKDTSRKPFKVALLDLDGHTFRDTWWNHPDATPFTVAPSGLSQKQQDSVVALVAWAFKDYRLKVTTSEHVFNAMGGGERQRLVLTTTHDRWAEDHAGLGASAFGYYFPECPVVVFTGGRTAWQVAAWTIHDLGHTVGLSDRAKWENGVMTDSVDRGDGKTAPWMGDASGAMQGVFNAGPDRTGGWQDEPAWLKAQFGGR